MVKFLLWLLLLVVCWPLALMALVLWPIVFIWEARRIERSIRWVGVLIVMP